MKWIALLLLGCANALATDVQFAWDPGSGYPAGVTYELQSNGVTITGITGTARTVSVPDGPGASLTAQVRAIPPSGYQCGQPPALCQPSAWALLPQPAYIPGATVPLSPVGLHAGKAVSGGGVMAAPTYVGTTESNSPADKTSGNSSVTRTTPSFSPSAGNILVGLGVSEDSTSKTIATNGVSGGPTWTQRQLDNTADKCGVIASTATAGGGSITVTLRAPDGYNGVLKMGLAVLNFSGSDGIGNTAVNKGTSGNPSLSLTTTQDNSAIAIVWGDWAAKSGTPSYSGAGSGTIISDYADGTNYGIHFAYYPDAGAAGAKSLSVTGVTNPNWTIVGVEVKGTTSAAAYVPYESPYVQLIPQ